jgi:hypothetical protein
MVSMKGQHYIIHGYSNIGKFQAKVHCLLASCASQIDMLVLVLLCI